MEEALDILAFQLGYENRTNTQRRHKHKWRGKRHKGKGKRHQRHQRGSSNQTCVEPSVAYRKFDGSIHRNRATNDIRILNRKIRQAKTREITHRHCNQTSPYIGLDIGSGKSKDNIKHWYPLGCRYLIHIEPSFEYVKIARKQIKDDNLSDMKNTVVNGFGHVDWTTGGGAADATEGQLVTKTFKELGKQVDITTLNMSVQFMLRDQEMFEGLLQNISRHVIVGGVVVIMFMNGDILHEHLKHNRGRYTIYNPRRSSERLFEVVARYDMKKKTDFGNAITVFFSGIAGLNNNIGEYLCFPSTLMCFFRKFGFHHIETVPMVQYMEMVVNPDPDLVRLVKRLKPADRKILELFYLTSFKRMEYV